MDYSIILKILFFSLSGSFLIFIWLHTNFVIEYYKLFKIKGILVIDEYIERNKSGFIENFPDFLKSKDDFLYNLLTCPICLSVWVGISYIIFNPMGIFTVGYLTFIFYCLLKKCYNSLF